MNKTMETYLKNIDIVRKNIDRFHTVEISSGKDIEVTLSHKEVTELTTVNTKELILRTSESTTYISLERVNMDLSFTSLKISSGCDNVLIIKLKERESL